MYLRPHSNPLSLQSCKQCHHRLLDSYPHNPNNHRLLHRTSPLLIFRYDTFFKAGKTFHIGRRWPDLFHKEKVVIFLYKALFQCLSQVIFYPHDNKGGIMLSVILLQSMLHIINLDFCIPNTTYLQHQKRISRKPSS